MQEKINWYKKTMKEEFKNWWIHDRNEIKKEKKWWKHLPNVLSSIRLFIAPLLPVLVLFNVELGIIFAVIGACTDCLDGLAARKLNAYSKFGEKLDTIADKLFSLCSIISISFLIGLDAFKISIFNLKSILFISLLSNITNEFIIGKINVDAFLQKKKTKSSMLGKIKTWPLFMTIIFSLITAFSNEITAFLSSFNISFISTFINSSDIILTTLLLSLTTNILQVITANQYKQNYQKEEYIPKSIKKEIFKEEREIEKIILTEHIYTENLEKEKILTLKKDIKKRFY